MRVPFIAALALPIALLGGCAKKLDGPRPVLVAITPNAICDAAVSPTPRTFTLTIAGSDFSPIVENALGGAAQVVVLPTVTLASSAQVYEVPQAAERFTAPDGTELEIDIPGGALEPKAAGQSATTYDLTVENPNGQSSMLPQALTVYPPPTITSVEPRQGDVGATVTVTITGTGFVAAPDGTLPSVTLDAYPSPVVCTNLALVSGTTITCTLALGGVRPGTYNLTLYDGLGANGCSATLAGAFKVVEPEMLVISAIDPPFGCTCASAGTAVTIVAQGGFVSTPTVFMRQHGDPSAPAIMLVRVAFISATTLTAVVPGNLELGSYDVTVQDPNNGPQGSLVDGFRVVSQMPPAIYAVIPGQGSTQADTPVTIVGDHFRPNVKVEILDHALAVVVTPIAGQAPTDANHISATFPTSTMTPAAYLVRVWDLDENTYSTFSNFVVTNPSGKLSTFQSGSDLNHGRRELAAITVRDDLGNRYLLAIGGAGAGGTALDTVEVSPLSKFGDLGAWVVSPNLLTGGRTGAGAVAVPVYATGQPYLPERTYLYVIGGAGAGGVLGTVERAMILRHADAPAGLVAAGAAGTLAAGAWYYQVSAVMDAADPDNPGGETLPSDEAILTLAAPGGVTLTWTAVAGATAYRVYRTDAANGVSQTEHRIAEVGATTYTDSDAAAGTVPFLPFGSPGVWHAAGPALATASSGSAVTLATDDTGARFVYVIGGRDGAGYLTRYEYAAIDDLTGGLGAFATGATALGSGRAHAGLAVERHDNVSSFTPTDTAGSIIWLQGGETATSALNGGTRAPVTRGGALGDFVDFAENFGERDGPMTVIVNDYLFSLGGGAWNGSALSNIVATGKQSEFTAAEIISNPSSTSSSLLTARALGAVVEGSGFLYFIGGTSDGSDALASTEQTID